jgi:hypothetical protein
MNVTFWSKIVQGRYQLGVPALDERSNINFEKMVCECLGQIHLTEDSANERLF